MTKRMRNWLLLFALVTIAFEGCVGKQKPQHNNLMEESLINLNYQSLLLLNIRTKNTFNTKYYLDTVLLFLEKEGKEILHRSIYSQNTFKIIDKHGFYNTYTLLTLEPGKYKLKFIRGKSLTDTSQGMSIGTGFFQIPVFRDIIVEKNKISYLGRIDAVLRERKENEFAAGPATPFIPQANTGIAKGTFDISIQDEYQIDQHYFISKYPALADQKIEKNIISPWDKSDILQYEPPTTHFFFWK